MNLRHLALLSVPLLASACLSIDPPPPVRTFHPGDLGLAPVEGRSPSKLRLERVEASPLLGERMVWRLSDVELARDELSRWSAPPGTLVAEALRQALFEGGLYLEDELSPRELTVRVTAFDGDLTGDRPQAHVRLVAEFRSGDSGSHGTAVFEEREPLRSNGPADLARGIGRALGRAVTRLRAWVGDLGASGREG